MKDKIKRAEDLITNYRYMVRLEAMLKQDIVLLGSLNFLSNKTKKEIERLIEADLKKEIEKIRKYLETE